jgi:hypothetical protein
MVRVMGSPLTLFRFLDAGEMLTLPDKLDSYALLFGLALLGSTWVALFLVRLALAPARLHKNLEEEISRLSVGGATSMNGRRSAGKIAAVQLVPSGKKMCLVITPKQGGVTLDAFVDVAHHRSGSNLDSLGWPKPERFYLGPVSLRAANLRTSIDVLEQSPPGLPIHLTGWLWTIRNSKDGSLNGSKPCFVQGKERVTFIFIDPTNMGEEKFSMLLIRPQGSAPESPPTVIGTEDFLFTG